MKNKGNVFDCEVCGNPLIKSRRFSKIKCIYCGQYVDVPGFYAKKEGGKNDRRSIKKGE